MLRLRSQRASQCRHVYAIRTPSGGLVRVGTHNETNAKRTVNAYVRARWPLTWRDLQAEGYKVEELRK